MIAINASSFIFITGIANSASGGAGRALTLMAWYWQAESKAREAPCHLSSLLLSASINHDYPCLFAICQVVMSVVMAVSS